MGSNSATPKLKLDALLSTKLEIPSLRTRIIRRERLTNQLNAGRAVNLIVAPAGYGKTTLLLEWISTLASPDWRFNWVTLDEQDNSPQGFWSYVAAGFRKASASFNFSTQQIYQCTANPESLAGLNPLFNEIARIPHPLYLVLDDYHTITNGDVHRSMSYLVEHLPDNLRVVLVSRSMPSIPLSRLRAQRKLVEISAQDLALTPQEAHMFLSDVLEQNFQPEQVQEIIEATEGWIAGLQLAASTLSRQSSTAYAAAHAPADKNDIIEYLLEEVLAQRDPTIRDFLVKTSILSELCAPLCDALLDRSDSELLLSEIEEENLFILPVDKSRTWFRYHSLFASALQTYLSQEHPELVLELHRRAYVWLNEHGYTQQAVNHMLIYGDLDQAATIIEACIIQALDNANPHEVLYWLTYFPEEYLARHPRLAIFHAMSLSWMGQLPQAEAKLQIAETALENSAVFAAAPEEIQRLRWCCDIVRAMNEGKYFDSHIGIAWMQELLDKASPQETFFVEISQHFLAEVSLQAGLMEEAARSLEEVCRLTLENKHLSTHVIARCGLGRARKLQSRLRDSEQEFQRALDFVNQNGMDYSMAALPRMALVDIDLEHNRLAAREAWVSDLVKNFDQFEKGGLKWEYRALTTLYLARYYLAHGDLDAAKGYFDRVTRLFTAQQQPAAYWPVEYIEIQAEIWLAEAHYEIAEHALSNRVKVLKSAGQAVPLELISLARVCLYLEQFEAALRHAKEAESIARNSGRGELLLKSLILQAMIHQKMGQLSEAAQSLRTAVKIAAFQGYARLFIVEGQPMKALLNHCLEEISQNSSSIFPPREIYYLQSLLSAFEQNTPHTAPASRPAAPETVLLAPVSDALSSREEEVLDLLLQGKNTKGIAVALQISTNTAKTHVRNIYRKYGVNSIKSLLQAASNRPDPRGLA